MCSRIKISNSSSRLFHDDFASGSLLTLVAECAATVFLLTSSIGSVARFFFGAKRQRAPLERRSGWQSLQNQFKDGGKFAR